MLRHLFVEIMMKPREIYLNELTSWQAILYNIQNYDNILYLIWNWKKYYFDNFIYSPRSSFVWDSLSELSQIQPILAFPFVVIQ